MSGGKNGLLSRYGFVNGVPGLAYEKLKKKNYVKEYDIYRPDETENVSSLRQLITDVSEAEKKTVVLALDAISYRYYSEVIRPCISNDVNKYEKILTSVFPSTTSSAWSSVITGELPGVHGVYGTSYRIRRGQTYVWLNDSVSDKTTSLVKEGQELFADGCETLFSTILHKKKFYIGRHGQSENNSFFKSVTAGIDQRIFPEMSTYVSMKYKPEELVEYLFDQIEEAVNASEESLIWAYFDFDDFIHEKGYDALNYVWKGFCDRLKGITDLVDSVILIADHGQTKQNQWEKSILAESEKEIFSLRICGAGRVLYLYGEEEKAIRDWAVSYYHEHAAVLTREEAIRAGLFGEDCRNEQRIGDVVVIGKDSEFHSIGASYQYEHGACTEDEMFVPAVIFQKKTKEELYFVCDLCDVLITGIEAFVPTLANYLHGEEERIRQELFDCDYEPLWKGKRSESEFFAELISKNHWDVTIDTFCKMLRESFHEIPGVREIYQELGKKYHMILMSVNIPEWVSYLEEKFAYENLFRSGVYYSYSLGYTKRQEECFLYLMDHYHLRPGQILYIDDSSRCLGVAKKLGIKGIHFENAKQLREDLAKYL